MRGGYAGDTLLPQSIVNLSRNVITSGANLVHNFKGTSVSPSPYPTSQPNQRPNMDVHVAIPPNLQTISASAQAAVPSL